MYFNFYPLPPQKGDTFLKSCFLSELDFFFPFFLSSFFSNCYIFFCSLLPHPTPSAVGKRMKNIFKPLEKTAVHLNLLKKKIEERNLKCETAWRGKQSCLLICLSTRNKGKKRTQNTLETGMPLLFPSSLTTWGTG